MDAKVRAWRERRTEDQRREQERTGDVPEKLAEPRPAAGEQEAVDPMREDLGPLSG